MTQQINANARKLPQILRTIKIMSIGLMLIGFALFFNVGDLAVMMNMQKQELHKTIGLIVIIMGMVDYYFIPKLLIKRLPKE